ncbi:hypothetical protein MTO96_034693 [Rhipicephalus appendiculatus]
MYTSDLHPRSVLLLALSNDAFLLEALVELSAIKTVTLRSSQGGNYLVPPLLFLRYNELLDSRWIYPVDVFVAVAHVPETDYLFADCHMVPPTITSRRLLQHVPPNAYPVRLGNTIWSLAYDTDKWPPNITFAVSLGMAGRWYRPKYPDNKPNTPGNYTLGFPCATEEHLPRGQMVNVTELCETKKNMTQLHYTFAAVNIQFEDAKDYCAYGEFPRLRALKVLARFFAFQYTSPR